MNDNDTLLQMMLVELRGCHPDNWRAVQRRIIDYFQQRARPTAANVEPHSFTGTDRTYADLVARETAATERDTADDKRNQ